MTKTILVIGTFDTKDDELGYLIGRIKGQGGHVLSMDVSVLGDPAQPVDITKHEVVAEAGETIESLIAIGEEGAAFEKMSAGAAAMTLKLYQAGKFDGMIALGGTMGTDLALDCAQALPIGVPKYIVSTVAGSSLIQADRMAADVQFILWAGGFMA
jgi:uncharacterized protein (UPF0261 family)